MSLIKFVLNYYNKLPVGMVNSIAPIYHLMPESIRFTPVFTRERERIRKIHLLTEQ